jgi:hypothetical protein
MIIVKNLVMDSPRVDAIDEGTGETLFTIKICKEGLFLCVGSISEVCINDQIPNFSFDLLVAIMQLIVNWYQIPESVKTNPVNHKLS